MENLANLIDLYLPHFLILWNAKNHVFIVLLVHVQTLIRICDRQAHLNLNWMHLSKIQMINKSSGSYIVTRSHKNSEQIMNDSHHENMSV